MKKLASLLILSLFLVSCGPSNAQIVATSNAKKTIIYAEKTISAVTQAALPTRTPRPTSTQDLRSNFEKCRDSGRHVRYVIQITSGNVSAVSITQENDTGGTDQGSYKLPYCKTYYGFSTGDFLYISAQIEDGTGSIECLIYHDNTLIAKASASGFASIATCS